MVRTGADGDEAVGIVKSIIDPLTDTASTLYEVRLSSLACFSTDIDALPDRGRRYRRHVDHLRDQNLGEHGFRYLTETETSRLGERSRLQLMRRRR